MLRSPLRCAVVLGLLALGGCRHAMPAPYARGNAPGAEDLLGRTGAQLPAIQVSKAKVIANRTLRGNLAFLAEAPGRFRGSVDFAGNELVTLAFHEQGYALRYKMDAFPAGFYEGPPSPCAVQALLGISFETEGLVNLVLGGAPVIAEPYEIREQKWDRRGGYERLVLANDTLVQELRFGWVGNEWRVTGGQLWERKGQGTGRRLWTVEHLELVSEGGIYLPTKTKVSTPGKRRDDTVMINYKERNTDPAFAKDRKPVDSDDPDPPDDPWEQDDPWEDEGGDWEDGAAPTPAGTPPATGEAPSGASPSGEAPSGAAAGEAPSGEAPTAANGETSGEASSSQSKDGSASGGTPSGSSATPPSSPAKGQLSTPVPKTAGGPTPSPTPPVPGVFQLDATGLTVRGDLCR